MRIDDIRLLFDYGYWATGRILNTAAAVNLEQYTAPGGASHGSLRDTLAHTLAAEMTWRRRCQEGISPAALPTGADFPTLATLQQTWQEEETAMAGYLATLDDADLDATIHYKTTKGAALQNPLWHILTHVVNHGTQHRSEAAMMLSALGHSPGDLDLILFLRQRST